MFPGDTLPGEEHSYNVQVRRQIQQEEEDKRDLQERAAEASKVKAEEESKFEEEMQRKAAAREAKHRMSSGDHDPDPQIPKQTKSTNAGIAVGLKDPVKDQPPKDQDIKDQQVKSQQAKDQSSKDQPTNAKTSAVDELDKDTDPNPKKDPVPPAKPNPTK